MRLRGRYKGFGTASVAVGAPLSLGTFQRRETTFAAEPLAEELMRRIAAAVPVVPAPLVCYVLLQADKPLTRAEIFTRAQMDIEGLPDANVHMPKGGLDEGLDTVLRLLSERNAILPEGDRWRVNPKKSDVLEYYANSIRHLM